MKQVCNDISCSAKKCIGRHPKFCKIYQNFGHCKFLPCAYYHDNRFLSKIETIKKKIEFQNTEIKELSKSHSFFSENLKSLSENFASQQISSVCHETSSPNVNLTTATLLLNDATSMIMLQSFIVLFVGMRLKLNQRGTIMEVTYDLHVIYYFSTESPQLWITSISGLKC